MATRLQLPDTTDIDALLKASATAAHAQYAPLLTHFDLARALEKPAAGLDSEGQDIMAMVLVRAVSLVAVVLDAAIAEAAVAAPDSRLTLCALQAFAALPVTTVSNWRHRTAVRRALAAMRREFRSTGHLNVTLPDEVRAKRDAYAKEVLGAAAPAAASQPARADNVVVFAPARTASPVRENDGDGEAEIIDLRRQRMMVEQPRPAPRKTQAEAIRLRADVNRQLEEESSVSAGAQTNMPAA